MTTSEIDAYNAMEELANGLGYMSVFDFTKIQIKNVTLQKIAYYQARVDGFEKKYGMRFEEFRQRVINPSDAVLSKFGIIEKEDDDNDWEDALDFIQIYSRALQRVIP
ncbi:hypothetical protein FHS57_001272 [Runella defluvii]|uniref:Uncharacterized protein n=1 Tax=Runella defluvii TaxID=370973 RepID=A0A7W5ZI38_9BACT|nr:hypothetical protein [Runella defluvii]MBB3837278.1 hypothetical protein [Runella defluvii]